MRIATNQMYAQNLLSLQRLQADSNKSLEHLATGKRVHTAADDPVAAVALENLGQQQVQLEHYQRNITLATNRLSIQESRFTEYENLVMNSKDLMLQGNNGVRSLEDRQSIAMDLQQTREALLALANQQDESGNYVFAGHDTATQPFAVQPDGSVAYLGDSGRREAQIADGVTVAVSESGQRAFMAVPNASGDYRADYLGAAMSGEFFVEHAQITDAAAHVPGAFELNFSDDGNGGVTVTAVDAGGNTLLPAQPFDASQPLSFNGMEVLVSGAPQAGDSLTLAGQDEVDIFAVSQQAIDLLETPAGLDTPQAKAAYAQAMEDMNGAINHATLLRAETGNALKSLDTYRDQHQSLALVTESARSSLEDLDYAQAIVEFEKQSLALNAVSQTFAKVSNLSLFNYL